MSSKDTNEERLIHSKSFNIETTINDKADQVIGEIFELFCSRYQIDFQIAMKCSSFLLDNVHSLHCKFHKVNLNCCGSYIIYPDQNKKKKKKLFQSIKMMIIAFNIWKQFHSVMKKTENKSEKNIKNEACYRHIQLGRNETFIEKRWLEKN